MKLLLLYLFTGSVSTQHVIILPKTLHTHKRKRRVTAVRDDSYPSNYDSSVSPYIVALLYV